MRAQNNTSPWVSKRETGERQGRSSTNTGTNMSQKQRSSISTRSAGYDNTSPAPIPAAYSLSQHAPTPSQQHSAPAHGSHLHSVITNIHPTIGVSGAPSPHAPTASACRTPNASVVSPRTTAIPTAIASTPATAATASAVHSSSGSSESRVRGLNRPSHSSRASVSGPRSCSVTRTRRTTRCTNATSPTAHPSTPAPTAHAVNSAPSFFIVAYGSTDPRNTRLPMTAKIVPVASVTAVHRITRRRHIRRYQIVPAMARYEDDPPWTWAWRLSGSVTAAACADLALRGSSSPARVPSSDAQSTSPSEVARSAYWPAEASYRNTGRGIAVAWRASDASTGMGRRDSCDSEAGRGDIAASASTSSDRCLEGRSM
ncbi:hypothetical protein C8T65DRAFT_138155 [Cerioporus squamosus]|nr:hypothetical protein C8T65DRAFT_138155 [Cerioporus squamosus]